MSHGYRTLSESLLPFPVFQDIIVPADLAQVSAFYDFLNLLSPSYGFVYGTIGIEDHSSFLEKNVIADKENILEDVHGKARSVTIDMEGLDAILLEVSLESNVKGETTAEVMGRVQFVNPHLPAEELPVLVGSAQEMMMGEDDDIGPLESAVER